METRQRQRKCDVMLSLPFLRIFFSTFIALNYGFGLLDNFHSHHFIYILPTQNSIVFTHRIFEHMQNTRNFFFSSKKKWRRKKHGVCGKFEFWTKGMIDQCVKSKFSEGRFSLRILSLFIVLPFLFWGICRWLPFREMRKFGEWTIAAGNDGAK